MNFQTFINYICNKCVTTELVNPHLLHIRVTKSSIYVHVTKTHITILVCPLNDTSDVTSSATIIEYNNGVTEDCTVSKEFLDKLLV
jgi:hypothetical protein